MLCEYIYVFVVYEFCGKVRAILLKSFWKVE
jgi:hypothetical protein